MSFTSFTFVIFKNPIVPPWVLHGSGAIAWRNQPWMDVQNYRVRNLNLSFVLEWAPSSHLESLHRCHLSDPHQGHLLRVGSHLDLEGLEGMGSLLGYIPLASRRRDGRLLAFLVPLVLGSFVFRPFTPKVGYASASLGQL